MTWFLLKSKEKKLYD